MADTRKNKRLVIFAYNLGQGGAERQLVALAKSLKAQRRDISVVSFYTQGVYDQELIDAGVVLHYLRKHGRYDILGFSYRAIKLFRNLRPDVVYSFLVTPNLFSLLLRPFIFHPTLIWSVRAAYKDVGQYDMLTRIVHLLENKLSRFAQHIVANSQAGMAWAIQRGFPKNRITVIDNGIDTIRFSPTPEAGQCIRNDWGVAENERLIGLAGRLDVMKDHPNFLKACALLAAKKENLRFACIGRGNLNYRAKLETLANDLGLREKLIWTGARQDMPEVFSALDIVISSSSFGEGFSNSIGEAMACGVPCVVTDVGDSARIVDSLGEVVPPRNAEALAEGMEKMLSRLENEPDLKENLKKRISMEFSLARMVARSEALLFGS